jgi:hypothetical protein
MRSPKTRHSIVACTALTALLGLAPSAGFAQVVYSPITFVPLLDGPLQLVLALLLGAVAFWFLRNRTGRNLAAAAILGLGAAFASFQGMELVSDAFAQPDPDNNPFDQSGGGQFAISCNYETHQNTTGVSLRVNSVTYPDCPTSSPATTRNGVSDECVPGYVIGAGGICFTSKLGPG